MPGIMFGMDQKDSNSSDEVTDIKRCNVTAVADDAFLSVRGISRSIPIMDEYHLQENNYRFDVVQIYFSN